MVRNPLDPSRRIHAVLFDVDGTLYRQRPVRMLMALELLTATMVHPIGARRRLVALKRFREAQEELRSSDEPRDFTRAQISAAATASGLSIEDVGRIVEEWMHERPLKYLSRFKATGLEALLDFLDRAGVALGVFSDYPAAPKLAAMRLDGRFRLVLSAGDAGVGRLKPHPIGFQVACQRWGLVPRQVLFVGDRPDVDAAGAAAAGLPCVIVGRPAAASTPYLTVPTLERLRDVLDDGR